MTADCLFCRIIAGEIPAKIEYQDENAIAFSDINPQAPHHYLIISKTHTPSHLETEDPTVYSTVMTAARELAKQKNLTDYRLVINNGPHAGQSVFHLHLHLLSGRDFQWPPG